MRCYYIRSAFLAASEERRDIAFHALAQGNAIPDRIKTRTLTTCTYTYALEFSRREFQGSSSVRGMAYRRISARTMFLKRLLYWRFRVAICGYIARCTSLRFNG